MGGGSRAQSRAERGIEEEAPVEAEVVALSDEQGEHGVKTASQIPVEVESEDPYEHEPIRADFVPQDPVMTGPAGAPQYGPPQNMLQREKYEKLKAEEVAKKEAERAQWIADAKAHKERLKKGYAHRAALRAEGFSDEPTSYPMEVEEEPFGNDVQLKFTLE